MVLHFDVVIFGPYDSIIKTSIDNFLEMAKSDGIILTWDADTAILEHREKQIMSLFYSISTERKYDYLTLIENFNYQFSDYVAVDLGSKTVIVKTDRKITLVVGLIGLVVAILLWAFPRGG